MGGFNVVHPSAPIRMIGIALGMTLLLNLVGMSIGPLIAGVFQQMCQGRWKRWSDNSPPKTLII